MAHHGLFSPRGHANANSTSNRFGRLFQPSNYAPSDASLTALGKPEGLMDQIKASGNRKNSRIALGFVFFGQFIDHDITMDLTPLGDASRDPSAITNFRTPALDLDCVFGSGPEGSPHLYHENKVLFGFQGNDKDLARNCFETALIGDPRNDENMIVSQVQLAMIKFFNSIVNDVRDESVPESDVFETAYQRTRWHYQWIVRHEFMNLILGDARADVLRTCDDLSYYPRHRRAFIPVEFSGAAYRFGHSQVPPELTPNAMTNPAPLFSLNTPFSKLTSNKAVDWSMFVQMPGKPAPQASHMIDAFLPSQLLNLPPEVVKTGVKSLATRNLLRGKQFHLPSGQYIARRICADTIYSNSDLNLSDPKFDGLNGHAPLWYYVLKEAELQHNGAHLGDVGATIVGETLEGLLRGDPNSYVMEAPCWKPDYANANGDFTLADLLAKAEAYCDPSCPEQSKEKST